jgi:NitT/TauT family transport system substrate-binding protein
MRYRSRGHMTMRPSGLRWVWSLLLGLALVAAGCSPTGQPSTTAVAQPTSNPASGTPSTLAGGAQDSPAGTPVAKSASSGAPTHAPPTTQTVRVTFGQVTDNSNHWPLYIAQEKGFFTDQGIELDGVHTRSSVGSVQLTASGSVAVATATADAAITGIAQGANVRIVGGLNRAAYTLVAQPAVKSYEDLRRKTIGTSALQAGETPLLRALLRAHGLNDDDYELIVAGGTPERVTAMRSGALAAAMVTPPLDLPLQADGFTILGSSLEVLPDFGFLMLVANQDWASSNRDTMVRLLRALAMATDWLHAPENRQESVRIIAERLNVSPQDADQTYETSVAGNSPLFYPRLRITESSLKNVLNSLVDSGVIDQSHTEMHRYVDLSYLEQAIQ